MQNLAQGLAARQVAIFDPTGPWTNLNAVTVMENESQSSPPERPANPLLVEVTRGDMVESCHRASVAMCDTLGNLLVAQGQVGRPVYARSAIKSLQAIALVESGAAAAYDLTDEELAIACASHGGEPAHVETVGRWLKKIGCSEEDLECGAHLPYHEPSMLALVQSGEEPSRLHNNCSGKHAGFLTLARHLDIDPKGYIKLEHPVQQRILGVLEMMTGLDLGAAPKGIDGCGIPVIGIPLGHIALAMARFADPSDQPESRQAAIERLRQAQAAAPFMVAGSERYCTQVMEVLGERAIVKTGAEGFFCGALPEFGVGIAIKVDDGATRAAELLMTRALQHFQVIGPDEAKKLSGVLEPQLHNRAGTLVGELHIAADCPF
ncbi:MAG: asparaginase [Pseudomonadota bacterium]